MNFIFRTAILLLACIRAYTGEFQILTMEYFTHTGMFTIAQQVLGHLYLYEQGANPSLTGFSVDFDRFGLYYDPERGPNWWSYYFEPIHVGAREGSPFRYPSLHEYEQVVNIMRPGIPRAQAGALIRKYIHVKRPILDQVDQFADRYFQNIFTIGVHYRGTDKEIEASRAPYEVVLKYIMDQIPQGRDYRIFVATDEAPFLAWIQEKFPQRVIATEAHRSDDSRPVHLSDCHNPYKIGEEALIDALLLSRCNILIRTASNLSRWSTYFNPELPVIQIKQAHYFSKDGDRLIDSMYPAKTN